MRIFAIASGAFILSTLVACSTAPVQPKIAEFSQVVTDTTTEVLMRYEREKIPTLLDEEFRAELLRRDGLLDAGGNCGRRIQPDVTLDDPVLSDFSRHCALVTKRVDRETREVSIIEVTLPDGSAAVNGKNAQRVALVLRDYSTAIMELAKAGTPQEVSAKFAGAASAVSKLAGDVKVAAGKGPLAPETQNIITTGSTFFGSLLREALEARRYRALKNIVIEADEWVQLSGEVLAGWYFIAEQPEIDARYAAFNDALSKQRIAAGSEASDRETKVAATQAAYDALRTSEEEAKWKVFYRLALAHRAVRESFDKSRDLAQLAAANDRIGEFASAAKVFFEAVKAAGK